MTREEFLNKELGHFWKAYGLDAPPPRENRRPQTILPTLEAIRAQMGDCRLCGLCEARTHIVFGAGNPRPRLLFVGEGPGAEEDQQGLPFVGKAGELLNKIIEAMGFRRDQVYIANVVKCRPPENRTPTSLEMAQCSPFLNAQIQALSPEVIVALGSTAASVLVPSTSFSQARGKFFGNVMVTYHPAYLLRNPDAKKSVWEDMKRVIARLEEIKK